MDRYYTQKHVFAPSQLPPLRTRREPGMTGENRRRTAVAAAEDQTEMQIIHASIQLLSVKTRGQTETLFLLQHSCLPVRQEDRNTISASTQLPSSKAKRNAYFISASIQLPSCRTKRQKCIHYFCFNTATCKTKRQKCILSVTSQNKYRCLHVKQKETPIISASIQLPSC